MGPTTKPVKKNELPNEDSYQKYHSKVMLDQFIQMQEMSHSDATTHMHKFTTLHTVPKMQPAEQVIKTYPPAA